MFANKSVSVIMAEKQKLMKIIPKNSRRWTETELNTYGKVLADPENNFALTLEKLALKKSANNEIFEHIKEQLDLEMQTEDSKNRNAGHFSS